MAPFPQSSPWILPTTKPKSSPLSFTGWFVLVAALVGSYHLAEISPGKLLHTQGGSSLWGLLAEFFPPDLSAEFLLYLIVPTVKTIQISIMGTALAILIGLPLGILATSTLTFAGILFEGGSLSRSSRRRLWMLPYLLARGGLSLLRSIPEIVWGLLFVRIVGLGPFAGVLAIGLAYGGMLGKVYAEILEGVKQSPVEAVRAVGARRFPLVVYGLFPQAFPNFVAYSLYRWECAIRSAAILGLVGAGGLGQEIEVSMKMLNYPQALTIILVSFILVTLVDRVSSWIRRTLL
ncbi:MAG: phosphonate ABC transporter, permease protein PhnE [Candidatus Tectomicrobia bacterium]|uniref:Phosphonate ABC transporter, permease protein PhnE n=1 Tax=Tectimicrobiota bacterium TaxID=2528274 RepID=A0A932M0U2_UNCTE|nr:phosphonate ABC transporter, permease protein PhnE [Candidatus Tectomicrobia bacterium]